MNLKTLTNFLNDANKATYADKDAPKVHSSRLRSEDYHFEKDDLIYHDTYFGSRDFIGEEIIYKNNKPVWGANYFGFILDEDVDVKEVYDFLRKALIQEYDDVIPVRGPSSFLAGDKEYRFIVEGNLSNFSAKEEILFKNKVVYRCLLHGGLIK